MTIGASSGAAHRFPGDSAVPDLDRFAARARNLDRTDRVLCSPAPAALACAAALGFADVVAEPALRDRSYGVWAGRSIEDVSAAEPDLFALWLRDPDTTPDGGESVSAVVERVHAWLAVEAAHEGRTIALTHPAIVRAGLAAVLAGSAAWFAFDVGFATRTVLSRDGLRWRIRLVNAPL